MIDTTSMTIKQLEAMLAEGNTSEDFIEALKSDKRAAAAKIIKKIERLKAEEARLFAMYEFEREAMAEGCELVAGVDEAGRGPLAGPVSVAAVILPPDLVLPHLNDSKKISAAVRDKLYDEIMEKAISVKQIFVDEKTIDRINILQATMNGMYEAIFALDPQPQKVLIDAVQLRELPMPSLSIIKGDAKSASIAAASIIAKVSRDRLMDEYDKKYPEYGFKGHKGYGTADHVAAIKKYGPCPIHRQSFEPIKSILEADNPFSPFRKSSIKEVAFCGN